MNSGLVILKKLKADSYQLIVKERSPLSIQLKIFLKRNMKYKVNYSKTFFLGYNTFFICDKSSKILKNI